MDVGRFDLYSYRSDAVGDILGKTHPSLLAMLYNATIRAAQRVLFTKPATKNKTDKSTWG